MHTPQFLIRPYFRSATGLSGLALTLCLLSPHPARAQWVASDASGVPLKPGSPGLNNDGSVALTGAGNKPTITPTGVYSNLYDWWLNAYSPNPGVGSSTSVGINSFANNFANNGGYQGFFDFDTRNSGRSAPFPPNVGGEVKTSASDTLKAYFVWIGPNPVPDHADFLLQTQVSASAATSYGQANPSSGLSATATATLGSDTKTVSASAPGDNHTASLPGNHLIRVAPSGKIVTITRSASVSTDTSNSVPFGVWRQQWPGSGGYIYMGDPANGKVVLFVKTV